MKYTIARKFIAIVLAACALVTALGCAFGIGLMSYTNMYSVNFDQWIYEEQELRAGNIARYINERFTCIEHSDFPVSVLKQLDHFASDDIYSYRSELEPDSWSYIITDENDKILDCNIQISDGTEFTFQLRSRYPVMVNANALYDTHFYDENTGQSFYLRYEHGPLHYVTITLADKAIPTINGIPLWALQLVSYLRYWVIAFIVLSLLAFAVCIVYLCCAAGRSGTDSVIAISGLNRMPLDVYAAICIGICAALAMVTNVVFRELLWRNNNLQVGIAALGTIALVLMCTIVVGFIFAVAAQVKMRHLYWWRHSIIGRFCRVIRRGFRALFRGLRKLYAMLPHIWRWILIGIAMGAGPVFFLALAVVEGKIWLIPFFAVSALDVIIVCYGTYAYGALLKGARQMAQGDLNAKISTRYLFGSYKQCAEHLNALADVAMEAAKNQMKSERMKTELITNVSHDIKTPLTSIINYVDLLQKPHAGEDEAQYLEVLGRQSLRLKKLIGDLIEMSKAASGNMPVDISLVDAAEAVNQALGEFSDKLEKADLIPIFQRPDSMIPMRADGRLTWRVLSNLLSNIVKYAMPGTRVYVDVSQLEGQVLISLKNISKESLNVDADELTERFVRGDTSRNTDGSGLGLNIAKSLMELQKGQLQLLVDGDLFKVTLVFPAG